MDPCLDDARRAQQTWAAMPPRHRRDTMRRLRTVISARMDEIVTTISKEIGKPPLDALAGDVLPVLEHLRYYEREAEHLLRPKTLGKPAMLFRGANFRQIYQPHGVALVLAPWNYPLQLAMVPAITALFAGNAVILKSSEHTPATAALIASLCHEASLPTGLLQVRADAPAAAAALLDLRPDIVFFTGSSRNGRTVALQAAERLIPAILELGGKDACLVFDSCQLDRAIDGVCYAAFANAGQVCVGAKRIFVQQGVFPEFLRRFIARAAQLRIGSDLASDIGPLFLDSLRERLVVQVQDAVARGAELHTAWDASERAVPPLILTAVPADALLLTEESFGPVVCVEPFASEDEAVARANASAFQLGASIFTGDAAQAQRIAGRLLAGSCTVNDAIRNVGNPYAPFGGNAGSGYGRYHGAEGLSTFSRIKTVMDVSDRKRSEIHWFPFQPGTFHALLAVLRLRHSGASMFTRLSTFLRSMKSAGAPRSQGQ